MKKLVLRTLWISCLAYCNFVSGQIPTNGLIAYYPFTGNAGDSSVNSNDGTVFGASLTTDRFGDPNRAYQFNGSSDYIEVPNSTSLQSPTTAFTLSAWAYITNISTLTWIIDKRFSVGSAPYSSYQIYSNNGEWKTSNGISNTGNTAITLNTWVHIVALYNGSKIYLYLDGVPVDSNSSSGALQYSTLPLYIGKSPNNAAYTTGKIDDIRIYDRALDPAEIDALYNEAQNTTSVPELTGAKFAIYPNPSIGIINIQVNEESLQGEYLVSVTNVMGQLIYSKEQTGNSQVALSDVTGSGIYFITLTDRKGIVRHTEKVLIR